LRKPITAAVLAAAARDWVKPKPVAAPSPAQT